MATITYPTTGRGTSLGHRVYAKTLWADVWGLMSHVYCQRCSWAVSPTLPTAELRYRHGVGRLPEHVVKSNVAPFSSLPPNSYVKIEIDALDDQGQPTILKWYGVAGVLDEVFGGHQNNTRIGVQTFHCVGLQWLLSRHYIDLTYCHNQDGFDEFESTFPYTYNVEGRPNRTTQKYATTYSFTDDDDAEFWTTHNIVEHLLSQHVPRDNADVRYLNWALVDPIPDPINEETHNVLPNWDRPIIDPNGNTTAQLLDQLILPQRGLGYYVQPSDDETVIELHPVSFANNTIQVEPAPDPPVIYLVKNSQQDDLDVSGLSSCYLSTINDVFAKYSRVHVRGARAIGVFTVSAVDGNLEKDWSANEEASYQAGATGDPNYPAAAEIEERQFWNQRARDFHQRAYRRFKIPDDWDGLIYDPAVPVTNDGPAIPERFLLEAERRLHKQSQILPFIPLEMSTDYTSGDGTNNPAGYQSPFAVFKIDDPADKYLDTRFLGAIEREFARENYDWSATLVPTGDGLAFDLNVLGQPQHIVDAGNFPRLNVDNYLGEFEWAEAYFTIAIPASQYCEIFVGDATVEPNRIRLIDAGESYQKIYLAGGTVLGTNPDGTLIRRGGGKWIVDDSDAIENIGLIALAWYGNERRAITFSTSYVSSLLTLGQMINNLKEPSGDVDVDTVITSIEFTSQQSSDDDPPPPRITYITQHTELDPTLFQS